MTEREQPRLSEQTERRHAVKRRGLIAGAAALVAGIVAKQTSQPVAAAPTALLYSPDLNGQVFNDAGGRTVLSAKAGWTEAITVFQVFTNSSAALSAISGAQGGFDTTPDSPCGVHGFSDANIGVFGQSTTGTGVKGAGATTGVNGNGGDDQSVNTTGFPIGVRGSVIQNGYGVYGNAGNGTGVYGNSTGGHGVGGIATSGFGVFGQSASGIAINGIIPSGSAAGTVAISGTNNATAANSHGIVGTAGSGHGLIGNTNFTGGGPPYYAGLVGNAPNGAYAGLFFGSVSIAGTLNGHTAIMQQAQVAVAHPDGTHRLVEPIIAPGGWMEDVGDGTLANGQATVKIAPDFAALIDTGKYHVFLTAHGNYHLHVAEMKADGFVVRVTDGGTSTPTGGTPVPGSQVAKASGVAGTFSWKVMAKRKDGQAARLATYTFPNIQPPHIPDRQKP